MFDGNSEINSSPLVSVVMPVYNGARTLRESVNSVLAQTFRDFELIICDDASTDETGVILGDIADERVRVIRNMSNSGEGPARDRAIASASGVWLAFIDADDAWAPERLETLLENADTSLNKMIFDDIFECHDTPHGMAPWHVLRGKYAFGGNGIAAVEVTTEKFVCQPRLLLKPLLPLKFIREYQISHGCRPFGADTEFFLQLLAYGLQLCYVPKPMYLYRITPGSMTSLTNRYALMVEVLENAIPQFENYPAVQAALHKKIAMVKRTGYYMQFFWALKKKQLRKAFQLASRALWVIPELFWRIGHNLAYQAHRIRNGGRTRGIR
jgi:glycosyltransferase involved in cell wall biosynthesis